MGGEEADNSGKGRRGRDTQYVNANAANHPDGWRILRRRARRGETPGANGGGARRQRILSG